MRNSKLSIIGVLLGLYLAPLSFGHENGQQEQPSSSLVAKTG
jgi:hypothetical protein